MKSKNCIYLFSIDTDTYKNKAQHFLFQFQLQTPKLVSSTVGNCIIYTHIALGNICMEADADRERRAF